MFNEYIETQNAKNIPGAHKINLETVMIGNGWFSPLLQYAAYYNFTVSPGNTYGVHFNESISNQMYNNLYGPGNCVDQLNDCAARGINEVCNAADNFCANEGEELYDNNLGRDEYDIRELTPDPFPYEYYVDYLNTPKVQAAIGAYQNYSEFSNAVGLAFQSTGDDGREDSTIEDLGKLLAQNITVMMYTGDADYICNCESTYLPHSLPAQANPYPRARHRSRLAPRPCAQLFLRRLHEPLDLRRRCSRPSQAGRHFQLRACVRVWPRGSLLPAGGRAGNLRARHCPRGYRYREGERAAGE